MEQLIWETAEELRNIFTQVPYRDIQEVINEKRGGGNVHTKRSNRK